MGTFLGTVSTTSNPGDYATLTFTGSGITVFANESSTAGSVTISVDGGNSQTISLANPNGSPNLLGEGDVQVYGIADLSAGSHTLTFIDASGTVALDRVQITPAASAPALGVSLTDGNVTAERGGVLPYTINYNNAGSLLAGTGVNATGVVLAETVPANTTADLANSAPGWNLVSGNGGAGSIYQFNIGSLNAGVTGSVVFSVDLNTSISAQTTSLTNVVSLADSASDTANSLRMTPLGAVVPSTTVTGTAGNDVFTLKQDPDHQHIDWVLGATAGSVPISDPAESLTLNGNGGNDAITLDYTNGNPLPAALHLSGNFTINGLAGTNPLADTTLEIGESTLFISYGSFDPITAIRSYLQHGYNGGAWNGMPTATTGVITSTAAQANNGYMIGYADSADGVVSGQPVNTVELNYTLGGDLNLAGTVNFTDFALVVANYGKPASWDTGAITYGTTVSFNDFAITVANYGKQAVSSTWTSVSESSLGATAGHTTIAKHGGRRLRHLWRSRRHP
jgi:hypothetical protein